MSFGQRLKELRNEKNLTQLQLSDILDTAKSNISKYEANIIEPNINMIVSIARHFNVSTDYLLGVSDKRLSYGMTEYADQQTSFNDDIGGSVTHCILKSGYGFDEVAEKLGISKELLDDYCSGMVMPLDILQKLSEICEVSTDCLINIKGKKREPYNGKYPFVFDPEISKRLKLLAKDMGSNHSFLTACTDLAEDETYNFVEYGFLPHIKVVADIAKSFNVSADYILNRTDSRLTISKEEEKIIASYRQLSEDYKDIALGKVKELIKEQERDKFMHNSSTIEDEQAVTRADIPGKSLA